MQRSETMASKMFLLLARISKITLDPNNSYRIHILYHENSKKYEMQILLIRFLDLILPFHFKGAKGRTSRDPERP